MMKYDICHNNSKQHRLPQLNSSPEYFMEIQRESHTPVSPPVPGNPPRLLTHRVGPGESLYTIAEKYLTTVEALVALNKLTETIIYPGQLILVNPGASGVTDITIASPMDMGPLPGWTPNPEGETVDNLIRLKEEQTGKDVDIYLNRGAYFYMTKMAIDNKYRTSLSTLDPRGRAVKFANTRIDPFYVLPGNSSMARLGDFGLVINTRNKKAAYAYFADWGPDTRFIRNTNPIGLLGEGSIRLGQLLDIKDISPDPTKGNEPEGIVYLIFPNSGAGVGVLKKPEEINREAAIRFAAWGGIPLARTLIRAIYGKDI